MLTFEPSKMVIIDKAEILGFVGFCWVLRALILLDEHDGK